MVKHDMMESYYREKFFSSMDFGKRIVLNKLGKDDDFGEDMFAFDAIFVLEAIMVNCES